MITFFTISFSGNVFGADLDRPVSDSNQTHKEVKIIEGVKGKVVSEDGKPLRGVLIQVTSIDIPSLPIPEIAIMTDESGRYVWRLQPGNYKISPVLTGYKSVSKKATVKKGESAVINFTLTKTKKKCR